MTEPSILQQLYDLVAARKRNLPEGSYTAVLFGQGEDAILRKLSEETLELVLAAKSGRTPDVVHEAADLLFHLWVLLAYLEIPPEKIYEELERRRGPSKDRPPMTEDS